MTTETEKLKEERAQFKAQGIIRKPQAAQY